MLIIPAIDIQDGCVVRFRQGRVDKKIYSRDPIKTARHWAKQGAKLIHVVDLDGAATGTTQNAGLIKAIVKAVDVPIELGGGIRSSAEIKNWLDCGLLRVILGTKAAEDRPFLREAFKKFKERILVSIDAKDSRVYTRGWQTQASKIIDALDFACELKRMGFSQVIYTDIAKDGTLKGPNLKGIKDLLRETRMQVIASGGISTLDDIHRLKALESQGLVGVIIGKALYEGRFTLAQALKLYLGRHKSSALDYTD